MAADKQQTITVYDQTATQMAQKFRRLGARTEDIDRAFDLIDNKQEARVVEIGYGDGRDAKEILKKTLNYTGIDVSKSFATIAKEYAPEGDYQVADACSYTYPKGTDIVFAFASLLHSPQNEVAQTLQHAHQALNVGGIFYISLKYAPEYCERVKHDEFGERLFYFYTPEHIAELAGAGYEVVWEDRQARPDFNYPDWFTIALRKL